LERTQKGLKGHSAVPHLIYFAPVDIQIARVDRNCIVKFCEAVAESHADVTLVSQKIKVLETEPTAARTIWDVFGVRREFELVFMRLPLRQEKLGTSVAKALLKAARSVGYPLVAARLLLRSPHTLANTALYTKNYGLVAGLRLARCLRPRNTLIVLEAHIPPRNRFQRWALKRVDGIVCNGFAVHQVLLDRGLIEPDRSIAIHQGFDPDKYPVGDRAESRDKARRRLGWSHADKVAVYTGKVYWPYAEVSLLLQAASQLAADGIRMVIVGGRADHVQLWRDEVARQRISNVAFVGFVAPSQIADYQIAADVLLSYYPSGIALNDYRSPGKLFEYMASGTPIVAADYASLREVLIDGKNAMLIKPDAPELLAQGVRSLVGDQVLSSRLGDQAREDAREYTWTARAQRVSAFVNSLERK
jgi:glycosyltransferase involved in cell wall biosynthesis